MLNKLKEIEANAAAAIAAMKELFADDPTMSIVELPSSYPQGAKQMILYNALGKVVYAGQRFATLGVIIINVSTLAKVAKFMDNRSARLSPFSSSRSSENAVGLRFIGQWDTHRPQWMHGVGSWITL